MGNKIDTKGRILETAVKLFYENGYSETGINEILEKSGSFKKSLYTHFSSKTDLGICYIQEIENSLINMIIKLMQKYPIFSDFTRAWIKIVKSKIARDFSYGCPLANLPANSPEISARVKLSFEKMKQPFISYFIVNYNLSRSKALELSDEILFLYEGAMTSYKLESNKKYFDILEKYLNRIEL